VNAAISQRQADIDGNGLPSVFNGPVLPLAIIAVSLIFLSCSGTSEKTSTFSQTSPQSNAGAPRKGGSDGDGVRSFAGDEKAETSVLLFLSRSAGLRSLAQKGGVEAQYQLAKWYATRARKGAPGEYAQASFWWHRAAKQGLAEAQYALGVLYDNGLGVSTDYTRAVHWYRQAADQGLAEAQYNLGTHCWLGKGMPRDAAMAVKWLHEAAEQGLPEAQYNLGLLLERGLGAPRNLKAARTWYTRAAVQGLAEAQQKLQGSPATFARTN
jgi:hypothetical protein